MYKMIQADTNKLKIINVIIKDKKNHRYIIGIYYNL